MDTDCNDGFDCTDDACVIGTGECSNTPVSASCDDLLFCTGTESCDPSDGSADPVTGCVATGNPCSGATPVCNDTTDMCDACADNGECDDSDDCTIDTCDAGSCSNVAMDCNDGDGCTIDSCVGGICQNDSVGPDCCDEDADCDVGLGLVCNLTTNLCEEAQLVVGCEDMGFSGVTLTLSPFPGSTPPDPLPTEPFTIVDGAPFGVVVSVGDLGNNEDVFMFVTLDDNEINGNPGDFFGQIFPSFIASNTDYVVVGQAAAGTEGTFHFAATLFSGATNDAGCENAGQEYNSTVTVDIVP